MAAKSWPGNMGTRSGGRPPARTHGVPRSGPLCHLAFWLRSRWDRLLDTVDARPGAGRDFPVQLPHGCKG